MRKFFILLTFILISSFIFSEEILLEDSGKFGIYLKNIKVGWEKFDISIATGGGKISTESQYKIIEKGKNISVSLKSSLYFDGKLQPVTYTIISSSSDLSGSISVSFKPKLGIVNYNIPGINKKGDGVILPERVVVVDQNVFSHLILPIFYKELFLKDKGKFVNVFVPQLALDGVGKIRVTYGGKEKIFYQNGKVRVKKYILLSKESEILVYIDGFNRILKIVDSKKRAEIIREE